MAEEKKIADPALAGFYEAMEKRSWLDYLKIPAIVKVLT
jgi:hypothetical protein